MAPIRRLHMQRKVYLTVIGLSVIIPVEGVLLGFGGFLMVLVALLMILKGHRKKKSEEKLEVRISGIKKQFNDIKNESVADEEDDWLEKRLKEDSDQY